jgi:hypothetical protein
MARPSTHKHTNGHGFTLNYVNAFPVTQESLKALSIDKADGSGKLALKTRTHIVQKAIANFGGLFEKIDLAVDQVSLFDTGKGKIDGFYIEGFSSTLNEIDLLGVVIPQARIALRGLTNHPDATQGVGWIGGVSIAGSGLSFKAIPELKFVPLRQGSDAVVLNVNTATAAVDVKVDQLSYQNSNIAIAGKGSLAIKKGASGTANVTFSGDGSISFANLGIDPMDGSLSLSLDNNSLQSLSAALATTAPIGSLMLGGQLQFNHNFSSNSGSVVLTNGTVYGIEVSGNLAYDPKALAGNIAINNVAKSGIDYGGFTFIPYGASLGYSYDASTKSVNLDFTNMEVGFKFGSSEARFSGNLGLTLKPSAASTEIAFRAAELLLLEDVTWSFPVGNAGKTGSVSLKATDGLTQTKLSLGYSAEDSYIISQGGTPSGPAKLTITGNVAANLDGFGIKGTQSLTYDSTNGFELGSGTLSFSALQSDPFLHSQPEVDPLARADFFGQPSSVLL